MAQVTRHLIVAVLAGTTLSWQTALGAASAPAQTGSPAPATFNISVRGQRAGQETVTLTRTPDGWLISVTGSERAPADFSIDKFEAHYSADWQPRSLVFEARSGAAMTDVTTISTSFTPTTAANTILAGGQTRQATQTVTPHTVVLPNNVFGAYEALAARLATSKVGAVIPVYVAPQAEITGVVMAVSAQKIQTPDATIALRHFSLSMKNPAGAVGVEISIDAKGRLARVAVPSAGVVVLRDDLSNVMARDVSFQNDTDEQAFIPGLGFTIAATTTPPPETTAGPHPAVVLIGGLASVDRDEVTAGVPIFAGLAGDLARAGFFVVRYDKRGVGQSGGRSESATIQDYADDAVSVVEWLRKQKDIDSKRIALVGYAEGGAVALLAGDRAGGKVAALGLIAAPGQTGREIILAQQQRVLAQASNPDDEKRAMVALQTRILDAVASGKWDGVPAQAQRAADTLMFRSWVEFDPAAAMKKTDQPIIIMDGALDTEMPPANADRLEALSAARKTKAAPLTKKVLLPGLNHLLVPAATGETAEYPSLAVKTVSPAVAGALADWLRVVMTRKR